MQFQMLILSATEAIYKFTFMTFTFIIYLLPGIKYYHVAGAQQENWRMEIKDTVHVLDFSTSRAHGNFEFRLHFLRAFFRIAGCAASNQILGTLSPRWLLIG